MHFENGDVAKYLQGANSVRDSALVSLTFVRSDGAAAPAVDLVFEKKSGNAVRIFRMQLSDVSSFNFGHEGQEPFEIAFCTITWIDEGGFYLSLDPWEEGAPSDRDNNRFRSRAVSMTIETR